MSERPWKTTDLPKAVCHRCGKGIEAGALCCSRDIFSGKEHCWHRACA